MNALSRLTLALALAAGVAAPAPAHASGLTATGQLRVPANQLVGFWETDIFVSPQACSPGAPEPPLSGHNTMVFNAGGTLVENPRVSPAGVPGAPQLRTFGLGKWTYDVRSHQFRALVRFDWYASSDGLYLGHMEIERTIQLSRDRDTAYGPVVATRYAPDGAVVAKLCGRAVSRRL